MSVDLKIFDLSAIERSIELDRKQRLQEFVGNLQEVGFVGIKVEGLEETIQKAYEITKRYFSLSQEERLRDSVTPTSNGNGYRPLYKEAIGNFEKQTVSLPDHRESFILKGRGKYPSISGCEHIQEFRLRLDQMANRILHLVQEYFEVSTEEKCDFIETSGNSATRLTHYPPMSIAPPNSVWCAVHQDINPFALLPRATNSGLQLQRSSDGSWLDVVVPENTVILNTGRLFEGVTAGLIKPTPHRVVAKQPTDERYSIIHFPCWDPEYRIKPWKKCLSLATDNLSPEKKLQYMNNLLQGKVSNCFKLYMALVYDRELSSEEVDELSKQMPDNELVLKLKEKIQKKNSERH